MITVCPLSAVTYNLTSLAPSHLISLLDPSEMIDTPAGFPAHRHLRVGVNDISGPMMGYVAPQESHVAEIIGFLRDWQAQGPLLVHCWAGVSRSTATAFIALCLWNDGQEAEAALAIRHAAPHAQPNRRIVQLADDLLRRKGRMIAAVNALPPGAMVTEGTSFTVPHLL